MVMLSCVSFDDQERSRYDGTTNHECSRVGECFPTWPQRHELGITASDLVRTKFANAFTVVMIGERWEQNPTLSEEIHAEVKQSIGRWLLTDFAIECPSYSYQITYDRLDEDDWFHHLLGKAWFYDPTDFLDAYEGARALALPNETVDMRS